MQQQQCKNNIKVDQITCGPCMYTYVIRLSTLLICNSSVQNLRRQRDHMKGNFNAHNRPGPDFAFEAKMMFIWTQIKTNYSKIKTFAFQKQIFLNYPYPYVELCTNLPSQIWSQKPRRCQTRVLVELYMF